jgi:acetyl-CoA acetyltransferase family protein
MSEVVIVAAVRTPIGKRNGSLKDHHPVDLSALVLKALVDRTGLDPALVDDVIWGCATQIGDQSSNVGRYIILAAGWPDAIPGTTINRACGSSQQAIDFAAQAILSGQQDIVVAGGVEVMSRVPLGAARAAGMPFGPAVLKRYDGFSFSQGLSAEFVAEAWKFSRAQLDDYAVRSQQLASEAIAKRVFDPELVPVPSEAVTFSTDECVRPGTNAAALGTLPPAFKEGGLIHAGNSSAIADGAAALLLMSAERAREHNLKPIARYRGGAVRGADPILMLTAPIPATQMLLARSGIALKEVGVYEVNEAFAPVPLAWLANLGGDLERLNPLGGAIAYGHPLGASGAILMTRMIHHMRRNGIRFGLQTMCEGGGTANATLLELGE